MQEYLPKRSAEDIFAGRVRLSLGGTQYVLPTLPIEEEERWKASIDGQLGALFAGIMPSVSAMIAIVDASVAALPPAWRRNLMVTVDGAGFSHKLVEHLDARARRRGYTLVYSCGWELDAREKAAIRLVPGQAWQIAVDHRGEVRERRAEDACADAGCGHRACWIEEAHVTELTGLLREGPGGDQLTGWPGSMRIFARRERPLQGVCKQEEQAHGRGVEGQDAQEEAAESDPAAGHHGGEDGHLVFAVTKRFRHESTRMNTNEFVAQG